MYSASAETFSFYISPDGEYTPDAISLLKVSGKYYLFLPGQADLNSLKLGYKGTNEKVLLNGSTLTIGDPANHLKTENVLKIAKKTIRFTVMHGSPNLPVLYITTQTGNLDKINGNKKYKEPAYLIMTDGSGGTVYHGDLTYMKMRGNATTKYIKKNYQIKLEKGTDLLGMGKAKKWILTGGWIDKSFIRNEISFDLAEYIGIPYTPQHQQAELYVNHEYLGLYLFSEKVEINNNRIEIKNLEKETEKLNSGILSEYKRVFRKLSNGVSIKAFDIPEVPDDITGGYLLEHEDLKGRYGAEPSGFTTKRGFMMVVKSPEFASVNQVSYIAEIMQQFENAICSDDGIDPVTGKHYYEIVDKESLVKKYLLNEFIKNYDGNSSSEFFYKPEDSASTILYAGPVWDLDNCYANYARNDNKKRIITPEGFFVNAASKKDNWWPNLYSVPDFYEATVHYFNGEFRNAVNIILGLQSDPSGKLKSLDEYESAIDKSAEMNYVLYPILKTITRNVQTGRNFHENVEYLRTFISKRLEFLEREWNEDQFLVK